MAGHRCADNSRQNHEPFLGSASPAQVWIALSAPTPWGTHALSSIEIGETNKKHLTALFNIGLDSRIQIITRPDAVGIVLFFAVSKEQDTRLYKIPLGSYDDILTLDWQALLANHDRYHQYLSQEAIFLICTNEQHDPCCGKFGQALFDTSSSYPNVWQSSHLGGDRFTANIVSLPQGNYYRRVDTEALSEIMVAEKQGWIAIRQFAGRSCYSRTAQIAYYYLLDSPEHSFDDQWHLIEATEQHTNHFQVIFENQQAKTVSVELEQINTGIEDYLSCHATTKSPLVYFQLTELKASHQNL